MNLPTDRPVYEGEIATYWFDGGILVSLSKSPKRTVANITGNVALVKKITGNKRVPLLIYLSNSPVPDKATRQFSTTQLPVIYSAMAMVSKPGFDPNEMSGHLSPEAEQRILSDRYHPLRDKTLTVTHAVSAAWTVCAGCT